MDSGEVEARSECVIVGREILNVRSAATLADRFIADLQRVLDDCGSIPCTQFSNGGVNRANNKPDIGSDPG